MSSSKSVIKNETEASKCLTECITSIHTILDNMYASITEISGNTLGDDCEGTVANLFTLIEGCLNDISRSNVRVNLQPLIAAVLRPLYIQYGVSSNDRLARATSEDLLLLHTWSLHSISLVLGRLERLDGPMPPLNVHLKFILDGKYHLPLGKCETLLAALFDFLYLVSQKGWEAFHCLLCEGIQKQLISMVFEYSKLNSEVKKAPLEVQKPSKKAKVIATDSQLNSKPPSSTLLISILKWLESSLNLSSFQSTLSPSNRATLFASLHKLVANSAEEITIQLLSFKCLSCLVSLHQPAVFSPHLPLFMKILASCLFHSVLSSEAHHTVRLLETLLSPRRPYHPFNSKSINVEDESENIGLPSQSTVIPEPVLPSFVPQNSTASEEASIVKHDLPEGEREVDQSSPNPTPITPVLVQTVYQKVSNETFQSKAPPNIANELLFDSDEEGLPPLIDSDPDE